MKTEHASWCWKNGRAWTSKSGFDAYSSRVSSFRPRACTCGKNRVARALRKIQTAKESE